MTEERAKELFEQWVSGEWSHGVAFIRAVAAESRKEGIDELRHAVVGASGWIPTDKLVTKEAKRLKEQG